MCSLSPDTLGAPLRQLEEDHPRQHGQHEHRRLGFPRPERDEGRAGAEARQTPANAKHQPTHQQTLVDVARGGEVESFVQESEVSPIEAWANRVSEIRGCDVDWYGGASRCNISKVIWFC